MSREMKDSGIEWIGEIPKEWEVKRAKSIFAQRSSKGNTTAILLSATQKHGMLPQSMLEGVVQTNANTDLQTFKTVHKNDYVISLRSFQGGFEMSNYEGVCSPAYQVFYNHIPISHQFFWLLFKSYGFIDKINSLTVGIREGKNIQYKDFANMMLAVPSFSEQQKIADYLDKVCGEIDDMVALQEKMIEELKAYKQSVITEAVTKGLNPNVPMRDSGIDWIGEIPEGWEITKILNMLSMPITDGPHETPQLYESGIPFISAEAVSGGEIDFQHMRGYISKEYYDECCKKYIPAIDDIYMIKSGATTGRTAIVKTNILFTIWSPLAVLRANKKRMLPYYLFYYLKSSSLLKQVENYWTYGTQQNIGMRTLEKLKICVPPLSEQRQIANYLDQKCTEIDELLTIKQQKIEELKEYKKSIIYEYVTGKKQVN